MYCYYNIVFVIILILYAAKIIKHPQSETVARQSSVTFTCSINQSHVIEWRVGDKEVYGMEYTTGSILAEHGVINFHKKRVNAKKEKVTDVIKIVPTTTDWNNTAIQCREIDNNGNKIYSKFAILHLQPESPPVSGLFTFHS